MTWWMVSLLYWVCASNWNKFLTSNKTNVKITLGKKKDAHPLRNSRSFLLAKSRPSLTSFLVQLSFWFQFFLSFFPSFSEIDEKEEGRERERVVEGGYGNGCGWDGRRLRLRSGRGAGRLKNKNKVTGGRQRGRQPILLSEKKTKKQWRVPLLVHIYKWAHQTFSLSSLFFSPFFHNFGSLQENNGCFCCQ